MLGILRKKHHAKLLKHAIKWAPRHGTGSIRENRCLPPQIIPGEGLTSRFFSKEYSTESLHRAPEACQKKRQSSLAHIESGKLEVAIPSGQFESPYECKLSFPDSHVLHP